jgi:hypothetical protein
MASVTPQNGGGRSFVEQPYQQRSLRCFGVAGGIGEGLAKKMG